MSLRIVNYKRDGGLEARGWVCSPGKASYAIDEEEAALSNMSFRQDAIVNNKVSLEAADKLWDPTYSRTQTDTQRSLWVTCAQVGKLGKHLIWRAPNEHRCERLNAAHRCGTRWKESRRQNGRAAAVSEPSGPLVAFRFETTAPGRGAALGG
ncbi:hypothetical protein MRX96_013692 [Rhipicephalus microplus]